MSTLRFEGESLDLLRSTICVWSNRLLNQSHHQVQWKTKTLAILHVGCFGVNPARRAEVMANLREQIWRAGGLVATPQSEAGAAAVAAATAVADDVSASNSANNGSAGRSEEGGRGGEDGAAIEGESRAIMLPLTRTASDGARAILPLPASASASPASSCSTAATSRGGGGGGVGVSGGGDSAGGDRPGLGPRTQSVSAALTQKEGLIHKVNAGLSGLESSIFFQLMLPESPSHPEAGRAVTPRAPAAAAASGVGQRPGPYPTFSGGASNDFVAAPEDRFAGLSNNGRYVTSYLRRQRWLWFFACPDAPNFGGACTGGGSVTSSDGGCDSAEWTTCRKKIINSLARSRRADGFVLVDCRDNEALMVKGIRIMLGGGGDEARAKVGNDGERAGAGNDGAVPGEDTSRAGEDGGKGGGGSGGGSSNVGDGDDFQQPGGSRQGEPRAMRMILQYRVFEVRAPRRVFYSCLAG